MNNEFLNQCIELFNTINPDIAPYVAIVSIVFFLTRGKNKWLLKIDLAHCQVNGLQISYNDLEDATNLSRPMVCTGINILLSMNIIEIKEESSGRKARIYKFVINDKRWAKIPRDKTVSFIKNLNNRGMSSLSALKIYLTLLAVKMNKLDTVTIGYEKIREYTGLQSKDIKPGLQVLFEHRLIRIEQELDGVTRKYKSNSYIILF